MRGRGRMALWLAAALAIILPSNASAAVDREAVTSLPADSVERALGEIEIARELMDESLAAIEAGDRDRAYDLAREAYLEHFEYSEIPLRLRDPNLVLDVEFLFADLRNGIESGKDPDEVREDVVAVERGLREVERELEDPGFAGPALAAGFSFSILFREGVEAVLIIAILLSSLQAARAADFRRPLAGGIAGAIAATVATFALATWVIDIAPVDRELLEAGTAALAVLVLFFVSFWLVSRFEHRRWMEFKNARVAAAAASGGAIAFAGLGFTAVYREGFETVLFYQALALYAKGLEVWIVAGAAAAAIALGGVAYAILKLGRKLPIRPILIGGASILLLLSVSFAGNAVRSFQEGAVIGVTPIDGDWARLPIFVAEITGIHPTVEGIAVQSALLTVYVLGAGWVFWLRPRRQRALREAQEAIA
jgi:high-affinity iron transporter